MGLAADRCSLPFFFGFSVKQSLKKYQLLMQKVLVTYQVFVYNYR